jgi:hypothetical protein
VAFLLAPGERGVSETGFAAFRENGGREPFAIILPDGSRLQLIGSACSEPLLPLELFEVVTGTHSQRAPEEILLDHAHLRSC